MSPSIGCILGMVEDLTCAQYIENFDELRDVVAS